MTTLVLVALLGFAGGMLAGLFGVGGGVLFVPTLALGLGLTQIQAEATSLLAILPAALAGAWRQQAYGNVRWRPAIGVGLTAIPGVQAGIWAAHAVPEETLRRLFGLLMLAIAAQVALRALRRP